MFLPEEWSVIKALESLVVVYPSGNTIEHFFKIVPLSVSLPQHVPKKSSNFNPISNNISNWEFIANKKY